MTLPKLPRSKYTGMHHQGCYIGTVYTQEHMRAYAQKAVAAEREACAKVCEEVESRAEDLWDKFAYPEDQGMSNGARQCADAIRARGDK